MTIKNVPHPSLTKNGLQPPLPLNIDEKFLYKRLNTHHLYLLVFGVFLIGLIVWVDFYFLKLFFGLLLVIIAFDFYRKDGLYFFKNARIKFITNTPIPPQIWQNEELRVLNLTLTQKKLIEAGLKDFFLLHALYPDKPVAMPSKMVDKLWHAFILDTKRYEDYCKKAFGKMFHHIPDYQFRDKSHNITMFTWQGACRLQSIEPAHPNMIPRLFAIDGVLLGTMIIGSITWEHYQQQMMMDYQNWYAQVYHKKSDSGCGGGGCGGSDSSCDVAIASNGDCSCGGSCGGGCGGGCGG